MPYRICKTFEVENGHLLSKHPDVCRFPHGHSRRVELVLEADELDDREMVCDFKAVSELAGEFVRRYDHAICMNTRDPMFAEFRAAYGERVIGFEATDPTTEVIAREISDRFTEALAQARQQAGRRYPVRDSVRVVRVRVWETSSSWAEYEA